MTITLRELTFCGSLDEARIQTRIGLGQYIPKITATLWRLTLETSEFHNEYRATWIQLPYKSPVNSGHPIDWTEDQASLW